MAIARYNPFHDMAVLQNRLNSIFTDFNRPGAQGENESLSSGSFLPAVDIYEDAQKLALHLEVPGLKPEEVDIRVENNTLTVSGERRFADEKKEQNYHRVERRYGSFVRSFTLPTTVNTEAVTARAENGVLTIELPKRAEAKPKQIKVEIGTAAQSPKQMDASAEAKPVLEHRPAA